MPSYCEVALPVPLDRTFTYAVGDGQRPVRGARVIAPFGNEKLIGIVVSVGGSAPVDFKVRNLEAVLDQDTDDGPLLSENLLELGEWMAQYYLAPLGEVLRGMLPLDGRGAAHGVLPHHRSGARCAGLQSRWRWAWQLAGRTRQGREERERSLGRKSRTLQRRVLERLVEGER